MDLAQARKILVDDLKLVPQARWDLEVKSFGGAAKAEAELEPFLTSLEKKHVPYGPAVRPLLSKHQRSCLLDPSDQGASLNLRGGRFVLVDELGGGGQGKVFRAILRPPKEREKLVAIKCIPLPSAGSIAAARWQ